MGDAGWCSGSADRLGDPVAWTPGNWFPPTGSFCQLDGATASILDYVISYLDHAATSPMRREAIEAMMPYITTYYGNPSGSHSVSRQARDAVEDARDRMAKHLGCLPSEVVFTSGGTEADNLAVMGVHKARGGRVLCSAFEHRGVLAPCSDIGATLARVNHSGMVDLDYLESLLDAEVSLLSVMLVNNEVGTIQPISTIARIMQSRSPQAVLHTDAVQAASWMDLSEDVRDAALISVSAHKVGGPKGVGVLVIREGTPYSPLLRGGSHENSRRPGTHNVAGIVGMAAAFDAAAKVRDEERERVSKLRDHFADLLRGSMEIMEETAADRSRKAPGTLSVIFDGVDQQELLLLIDEGGVCASGGSACSSGAIQPSHVLLAMGYSHQEARGAVRFSLGHTTTLEEIELAAEVVISSVEQLRKAS
ncbi:MAG: cysteine desulfurase [Actinobacteria bacterium]|nr:cysteine desulfurase [Actinomycetota bacterium]